jgi:hypothetical protein
VLAWPAITVAAAPPELKIPRNRERFTGGREESFVSGFTGVHMYKRKKWQADQY